MGVYADFLAHTTLVDTVEPQVGSDRIVYNELLPALDPPVTAEFGALDEVQGVATHSGVVTGGNYTLTVVTPAGVELTTANLAHDAIAATVESGINTACAGIAGWTNGDISVSGGPLTTDPLVLTFDGAAVTNQNFGQTAIVDVDLSGGGTAGAVSTTTHGQPKRYAWAVMYNLGLFNLPPAYGEALATDATLATNPCDNPHYPSASLRKVLARQAAIDDENLVLQGQLESLFHIQ